MPEDIHDSDARFDGEGLDFRIPYSNVHSGAFSYTVICQLLQKAGNFVLGKPRSNSGFCGRQVDSSRMVFNRKAGLV
jgi:hypothetical protein